VIKHAYFGTRPMIDGVFCVDMRAINKRGTRFNRHAGPEWDCGRL